MTAKHVITAGGKLVSATNRNQEHEAKNALREFIYALGQTLAGYETRLKELEERRREQRIAS
jgi:hypothetical protein